MTVAKENLLIIKLGALGDIFTSEGAIRRIRRAHPEAEITILTGAGYTRIFHRHPAIDHVLSDPRPSR